MLRIPSNLISEFLKISASNFDNNGELVETLAFLSGTKNENGELIGTHLIFPEQHGEAHQVDDKGKVDFSTIDNKRHRCCTALTFGSPATLG